MSVLIVHLSLSYAYFSKVEPTKYESAINVMKDKDIIGCKLASNDWVLMNYLGKTTEPYPRKKVLGDYIEQGNFVLLFYGVREPSYVANESFLDDHQQIYESKGFVLLGDSSTCNPQDTVNETYSKRSNEYFKRVGEEQVHTNPCKILFEDVKVVQNICIAVNNV